MEDDRIFIASGNAPSTHILKPPIRTWMELSKMKLLYAAGT